MAIALTTPAANGTSFECDIDSGSGELVITSQNNNEFRYRAEAIRDLYIWLKNTKNGEWVNLGPQAQNSDSVDEWARSSRNPMSAFYDTTPGNQDRFSSFIPPILETLGLVELEHGTNNNRIKAR